MPVDDSANGAEQLVAHRWKPGQSGCPGGRGKGLVRYIRDQTRNGEELIDRMLEVARGEMLIRDVPPSHRDRLEALRFLLERGLGRELESANELSELAPGTAVLATYTSTQLLAIFDRVRQAPVDQAALPDTSADMDGSPDPE